MVYYIFINTKHKEWFLGLSLKNNFLKYCPNYVNFSFPTTNYMIIVGQKFK